jgi:MFS family permease
MVDGTNTCTIQAVIIAFCALFAINTMFFLSNDILIDHVAENQSMGSTRGSYLTALNIGYVLAPSVSGFILARMGFSALYTLAALLLVPLLIIIINNHSIRTIHISKINIFQSMKTLWHNRNVRNIALANFLLQFFYAWMVIYTPIFLHEQLGIPWDSVGTLFSIMLFAFVLTQIPLGRLADRHLGEKYLLIIGFVVISITTSLLFFLPSFTLPLLGLILFGTRIGASCIEVLTESYFFKKVPRDESGEISIFRNMYPIAYIIALLIGSLVLRWLPVHYLFLILGIILLCGILFIIPIQNTK